MRWCVDVSNCGRMSSHLTKVAKLRDSERWKCSSETPFRLVSLHNQGTKLRAYFRRFLLVPHSQLPRGNSRRIYDLVNVGINQGGCPFRDNPLARGGQGRTRAPAIVSQYTSHSQECISDLLCADMKIRTAAIYPSISRSAGGKWPSRDH